MRGSRRSNSRVGSKALNRRKSRLPLILRRGFFDLLPRSSSKKCLLSSSLIKARNVSLEREASNFSSTRWRTVSSGVLPSKCCAMKYSASPSRKKLPEAGSLTTKKVPAAVTSRLFLGSFGRFGREDPTCCLTIHLYFL